MGKRIPGLRNGLNIINPQSEENPGHIRVCGPDYFSKIVTETSLLDQVGFALEALLEVMLDEPPSGAQSLWVSSMTSKL